MDTYDATVFLPDERVEIVLPRPFDHGFDYVVPQATRLRVGDYVQVPFGPRELVGVVWGPGRQDVPSDKCKSVTHHCATWPAMATPMRALIDWCADYTLNPKGAVLKMALPLPKAITEPPVETIYRAGDAGAGKQTAARAALLALFDNAPTIARDPLLHHASSAVIAGMRKAGMLIEDERIALPAPALFDFAPAPALRAEQQQAVNALSGKLGNGFSVSFLDGITGSGKTEVYFDLIEQLLKQGGAQVLVLLPEIVLATQWMARFEQRFGCAPVLWHSSVSIAQRKHAWQAIVSGAARLVVGARSALFLPYRDLRLIVVDEEHEPSYKQEDGVRYHARDMAVVRAKLEDIPALLVSATPSLETVANIQAAKYTEHRLRERHGPQSEAVPQAIDLRTHKPERGAFLSPPLRQALLDTLAAGHQSMLFLNRRGYAPLMLCRNCGHRFECANCSAWMVAHQHPPRLQCHHCDTRMPMPTHCPQCESDELAACGPGVERVAEEVAQFIPQARVATLTSDDAGLAQQIAAILNREIDVIIGTQLVAKGHHFPHLALVGVVDADLGLQGGDLRASERTYQLMHQLSGRAGRDEAAGTVLLQTTQPEHPVMQALIHVDRDGFIAAELSQREQAGWPPYGRLAAIILEGHNEAAVQQLAQALMRCAPRYNDVRILGPAPAPIARQRNLYRYRLLVKAGKHTALSAIVRAWTGGVNIPSAVKLRIDVDPYSFV